MDWTFDLIVDFVGPLFLLIVLALGYCLARRHLAVRGLSPDVMGILFGLVAMTQMNLPFEPVEGLIIDMRNLPVALAGAFLGLRGLVYCLIIAAAARIQIGGVGMESGLFAILLAGAGGVIWNHVTTVLSYGRQRSKIMLLALGPIASIHLLAVTFLPANMAMWFLTEAAPVILLLNFLVLPFVAWILDRDGVRVPFMEPRASATNDQGEELPTLKDLSRHLIVFSMSSQAANGVDIIAIRPCASRFGFRRKCPPASVLGSLHRHLLNEMPKEALLGVVWDETIVAVVPRAAGRDVDHLSERLRQLTQRDDLADHTLSLEVWNRSFDKVPTLSSALVSLRVLSQTAARRLLPQTEQLDRGNGAERLFSITEQMIACEQLDNRGIR